MIPAPLEGNHAASPAEENPICAKEPKPKEPKKKFKNGDYRQYFVATFT